MRAITKSMKFIADYRVQTVFSGNEWRTAMNALKNDKSLYAVILEKSSTDEMLTLCTRGGSRQVPNVL